MRRGGGADGGAGPILGRPTVDRPILDRLLALRGIAGEEGERFLKPSIMHLGHPVEMPGMRAASEAICEAVREGRRIAIYGDYDADGVMASTILWHLVRALGGAEPQVYIPHRIEEGYGLNRGALEQLARDGAALVVTVDCGVAAPDEAAYARELGLDLVITDHHEPRADGRLPEARAVVHPRIEGAAGFGELCGAAVAWKLAWMTLEHWHGIARERVDEPRRARLPDVHSRALLHWLAFAAVGTVADIVPLVGENRAIVAQGLPLVHRTGNAGMDALLAEARLDGARVDAEAVAFQLAPRINAAGRMRHASLAAELFTSADARQAAARARELSRLNDQRRRDDRAIFEVALARVESRLAGPAIVEGKPGAAPRGIVLWDDGCDTRAEPTSGSSGCRDANGAGDGSSSCRSRRSPAHAPENVSVEPSNDDVETLDARRTEERAKGKTKGRAKGKSASRPKAGSSPGQGTLFPELEDSAVQDVPQDSPEGAEAEKRTPWSLGIVGIVCSKLVERFACPAVLLTRSHDGFRGSGRSVDGIDLHGILESCSEHLTHFGGHAMAAGMGVADVAALERFEAAFVARCDAELSRLGEQKLPLEIDAEATIGELDLGSVLELERLAPFGRDNPRPAFLLRDLEVTQVKPMGADGSHLSLMVRDGEARHGRFLRLVRMRGGAWAEALSPGMRVDAVIEPKINEFRGERNVEGVLLDLAPAGEVRIGETT
ncbi:MAG: single-stranded-DNA-specific exonuclease RecJ [Planctomycetota bacterium]